MPNDTTIDIDEAREQVYASMIDYYKILLEQLRINKRIVGRVINLFVEQMQELKTFPARDLFIIEELKKRKIEFEKIQTLHSLLIEVNKLYFLQRVIFRLSLTEKNEPVISDILGVNIKSVIYYKKLAIENINNNLAHEAKRYFHRIVEENLLTDWGNPF